MYVGKHHYEVGAPVQFDPEYPRITVLEHVLEAVGADIVNSLNSAAGSRRVIIENVEAIIHGQLHNALTHLRVLGEEGDPGIQKIDASVYVSTLAEREVVESLWEETLKRSLMMRTLSPRVQLVLSLKLVT